MAPEPTRRAMLLGPRAAVLLSLALAGIWGFVYLGLDLDSLWPSPAGLEVAGDFFSRAFSPSWESEADFVPVGTPPLLVRAFEAARVTIVYAAAAMSLSVLIGLGLGFLASSAWWRDDPAGARSPLTAVLRRSVLPAVYVGSRALIAFLRSIHELLWAVLFLTAFGVTPLAAVLAIALPYGGTLAKIFSEMVDEAPTDAAFALRGAGATGAQVFSFGLLPLATPDMIAYTFYRFECALRSAAVLGFFGFPTIGLYIRQSFKSLNYGEVWTYLYVLIAVVVVFDVWSGQLRRRVLSEVPA